MTTIEKFWEKFKKQKYRLKKADVEPQYIIASEEVELEPGNVYKVPVKNIRVPKDHVIHLSPYSMHCNGSVTSLCEKTPKPIHFDRYIENAYFHAAEKGKISKDDVLGHFMAVPLHSE